MKKMPKDWRVLNDLFGLVDAVKNQTPETTKTGLEVIMDKIYEKRLTAHDLQKILGMTYRMIGEWEIRQKRFFKRQSTKKKSWRLFSIEDVFSFAVLLALKHLKIPVSRNRRLVETIRSSFIIQSIIFPFTEGKKTFLYHDNEKIAGFYVEGRTNMFDNQILEAVKPLVFIPLNGILRFVLERSTRDDFHIEISKETQKIVFYVDGRPVDFKDQVPIVPKPAEDTKNK
jgi:hypothetical protein